MGNRRPAPVDWAAVRSGQPAAVAMAAATCAARWFSMADTHIAFRTHASSVVERGGTAKAGLLAAALDLRELLAQIPEGRQALRNFGFEPLPQDVEGE